METLQTAFIHWVLATARILAAFVMLPVLSTQVMGGNMLKNGVALSLSLFIYPVVAVTMPDSLSIMVVGSLLIKEGFLGIIIGFSVAILFWAVESVGFFIDNQRGATMASSLNPLSGSQTSPLGILLAQGLNTLFFSGGGILLFLGALYQSYLMWPIGEFTPNFSPAYVSYFLHLLDLLMNLMMLVAAPIVIAMFFSEFGLAMVGRFAPQLDVFFLAMPVKSAVAFAFLTVYVGILLTYFNKEIHSLETSFSLLFNSVFSKL
ncbi:type III secretion system export apparatus subunit SctT [Thalassomonas viridans]|uniref:Type III secretion system export apparatus subunit SctT n=1 Tax=Thalassomonas viridans TaxID=137584 RepID=A0AAF0CB43_9GAMM|nr:type III secretion system export apparatus subunit SctT [Thalassomonas viridans]